MKKLGGILGTLAGITIAGIGIHSLVKKGKETEHDVEDYQDYEESEVDDEESEND